ncbi:MAG: TetR family transcriptional regulator [Paenibacillaceae bacterium]|jgi:AcrR family transcriptional regulator|nr:TetR family transcriptional regulator [Paenibacillaceae bacterium]
MGNPANPHDPRVKRTRRLLQHAFMELLGQKSFEAITIQDITERAELNRATFYSHFQDKYELLELTLSTMFNDVLHQWIPSGSSLGGEDLVRRLMLALCQWQIEAENSFNRKLTLSAVIEQNTKKQLYSLIHSCLKQADTHPAKSANLPSDQANRRLEILSAMLSHSIHGIVLQWGQTSGTETAEELVDYSLPFIRPILGEANLI